MEDVHMEDAGPAVRTEDKPSASSTESSGHSQDVVGSVSTELPQADSSSTSNPSLGKNLHTGRGQEPKISEQGNNTRTPATTATTTMSQGKDHVEERPTGTASVMMMMDVDPTIQSEDIKSKEENIQDTTTSKSNAAASFSSTKSQATTSFAQDANLAASGIVSTEFGIKQFESSSASMDQSATSDTQQQQVYISSSAPVSNGTADKIESASSSEDPQLKTEVPGSGSTEGAGSSTNTTTATTTTTITTPATAAAATVPPSQPVRTYIPQFKFTTFAPMTPLPTRNVTSNFLKTEKNFVLKNMARRRRRKRKVEDEDDAAAAVATQEEDKGGENMGTEDNKTEEEKEEEKKKEIENGILKRKRKDEYSAIRRGIFADEENEDDDKEDEDNDNKDENVEDSTRKKDGEDEYEDSSDSDTEEGNVNEMDENGEAKSSSDAGKKIIVIHPGSRILRIGKASDAYPVAIPHYASGTTVSNGEESSATEEAGEHEAHDDEDAEDDNAMEVDVHEETSDSDSLDVVNDKYLREIENDLKIRMKAAKRRPVPNAKSQVKSFNSSTEPERILDINDPYKVEWTDPVAEGEYIIGQK
ncbi:actin-like protein arp8, partial [Modicella reniformis]